MKKFKLEKLLTAFLACVIAVIAVTNIDNVVVILVFASTTLIILLMGVGKSRIIEEIDELKKEHHKDE